MGITCTFWAPGSRHLLGGRSREPQDATAIQDFGAATAMVSPLSPYGFMCCRIRRGSKTTHLWILRGSWSWVGLKFWPMPRGMDDSDDEFPIKRRGASNWGLRVFDGGTNDSWIVEKSREILICWWIFLIYRWAPVQMSNARCGCPNPSFLPMVTMIEISAKHRQLGHCLKSCAEIHGADETFGHTSRCSPLPRHHRHTSHEGRSRGIVLVLNFHGFLASTMTKMWCFFWIGRCGFPKMGDLNIAPTGHLLQGNQWFVHLFQDGAGTRSPQNRVFQVVSQLNQGHSTVARGYGILWQARRANSWLCLST